MNKLLTAALLLGASSIGAAPASAVTTSVDGPADAIADQQTVDVDMAPDGTAALAYLKEEGGLEHVFVSRLEGGAWTAPQRVDTGLNTNPSRNVSIAVANGGKIVVTFLNAAAMDPEDNVYSAIKPNAASPFAAPTVLLSAGGRYAELDMAPDGVAYAAIGTFGNGGGAVFAKRLDGTSWSPVGAEYPDFTNGAFDQNEANGAGETGDMRGARPAVAPDGGSAVVAFTEETGLGEYAVIARRLTGTTRGPPVPAGVASFGGSPAASAGSDMADVDIDASGTAWVVMRQGIDYAGTNHPRCLARALTGNAFGAPQLLDALPTPPGNNACEFPRVDVTGAGAGLVAGYHQMPPHDVDSSTLSGGAWSTPFKASLTDNDAPARTAAALGENGSGLIAWRHRPAGTLDVRILARTTGGGPGPELTLSNGSFGSAGGSALEAGADNGRKALVAFVQGAAANARVVAAVVDLPRPRNGGADISAPDVTALRLSRKRFRRGSALPSAAAVGTGTVIHFRLSEAAPVRLTFSRALPGRRVGRACRKQTRRNRSRRRCTRFVKVRGAAIRRSLDAGARRIGLHLATAEPEAGRLPPRAGGARPGRQCIAARPGALHSAEEEAPARAPLTRQSSTSTITAIAASSPSPASSCEAQSGTGRRGLPPCGIPSRLGAGSS
jgi:hypothetical protein